MLAVPFKSPTDFRRGTMQYSLPFFWQAHKLQQHQQCTLHVRSHKITFHCGASVWAPLKWDPLSLPQLNTVWQYLSHPGLIIEIWHTQHSKTQEKCWHPTAILCCKLLLESQKKPKMRGRGNTACCWGR